MTVAEYPWSLRRASIAGESEQKKPELALRAGAVISPAAPSRENDVFTGRTVQVRTVIEAINPKGQHGENRTRPGHTQRIRLKCAGAAVSILWMSRSSPGSSKLVTRKRKGDRHLAPLIRVPVPFVRSSGNDVTGP
jgi:hypothetical protein